MRYIIVRCYLVIRKYMKKLHTEDEIITSNTAQIYQLAKLLETQPELFYQVAHYLPFVVFQSKRASLSWSWGNKFGLDFFEIEKGDAPDITVLAETANEKVLENNILKIKNFDKKNDKYSTCSYYQLYEVENKNQWVTSVKAIINEDEFFSISYFLKNLGHIGTYIYDVIDTTLADVNAWKKFQSLTVTEKKILQLLGSGQCNKSIASLTFTSENTVRTHRKNIYRKIDANNLHDLIRFSDAFKLADVF